MSDLKREFYEVEGVAKLLNLSLCDMWHLIEIGRIDASFRQIMADTTVTFYDDFTVNDFIANRHTFLIPISSAKEIAIRGSCLLNQAFMYLAEPKEELMIDHEGEEFIGYVDTFTLKLDHEVEITKNDVVISQLSIERYQERYRLLNNQSNTKLFSNDKLLGNKERETLLVIIAALAKEAKVDIGKISKAGELIANMTQIIGAPIGATTIETHLKKIPEALQSRTK